MKEFDMKGALKVNPGKDMIDWVKENLNVPKEVSAARLKICHSCELYRKTTRTCKACNCFMPGKVNINQAVCPEGKWGRCSDASDEIKGKIKILE